MQTLTITISGPTAAGKSVLQYHLAKLLFNDPATPPVLIQSDDSQALQPYSGERWHAPFTEPRRIVLRTQEPSPSTSPTCPKPKMTLDLAARIIRQINAFGLAEAMGDKDCDLGLPFTLPEMLEAKALIEADKVNHPNKIPILPDDRLIAAVYTIVNYRPHQIDPDTGNTTPILLIKGRALLNITQEKC